MPSQFVDGKPDHPWPSRHEQVDRRDRPGEDDIRVDVTDQLRIREAISVEFRHLLPQVVVAVVWADLQPDGPGQRPADHRGPGARAHHDKIGEILTPLLDGGQRVSQPREIPIVAAYQNGRADGIVDGMYGTIPAFWCRAPSQGNVGDRLTPWLVRRISGRVARWVPPRTRGAFFVTGSVIALAGPGGVVWGAGILDDTDRIHPEVELAAVRGPLTREAAMRSGVSCPEVFGDPALLVSRFLPRGRDRVGRRPAVVPHFSDKARAQLGVPRGWDVVDVQAGVEEVVDRLVGAPLVASSSLHGIILSHAYGVPAAWVSFGGRDGEGRRPAEGDGAGTLPNGDDSKFHDYFLSVGLPVPPPVQVGRTGTGLESGRVRDFATVPAYSPDLDLLLDRCPFR